MVERKAGQDGQNGQSEGTPFPVSYFIDPWTGRGYWKRDVEGDIRRADSSDPYEGAYGDSPLAHLSSAGVSRGRHTKRNPSEE